MLWIVIILAGLAAGTLGGLIGFGATTIVMPLLVFAIGPKAAVPVMAIAAVMGNFARVVVWRNEIAWRAVAAFALPSAVAAWLGVRTMLALDPQWLEACLGAFFVLMIPIRRWMTSANFRVSLTGLAIAGTVVGYLTGIVANTGPINTPFFLAHGLTKGAFVGTEAMASLAMFTSKSAAFAAFAALSSSIVLYGVVVGTTLMLGARFAKGLMHRLDADKFNWLMDALLLVAGLAMLFGSGLAI